MLTALSVRDLVLIDTLDLEFEAGLAVLTGETGAGKSILLDALGLALGGRGSGGLVRPGAKRAQVTASFEPPRGHPCHRALEAQGLDSEDVLILRRQIDTDGRSRAFVNDQPIGVALLREIGVGLAEVQGQFDQHGVADPATHLALLDAHGGLAKDGARCAGAWRIWRKALAALEEAEAEIAQARKDEDFLRHAVAEIDRLGPKPGEAARLAEMRSVMMNREKIAAGIAGALTLLEGPGEGGPSVEGALQGARAHLARISAIAQGPVQTALSALEAALTETSEAVSLLHALTDELEMDAGRQEQVDDRLFALRQLARKHAVDVDALADHGATLARRLETLENQDKATGRLREAEQVARRGYEEIAGALSRARAAAAAELDRQLVAELPSLKLEKARFVTEVEALAETRWGPKGRDFVQFTVAANPGAAPAPLGKVASGGERSRILLALKVALAKADPIPTLVFDEVDSGVGGATAAAVGERLGRLAQQVQVLVVTHSPQVAALGQTHWHVEKRLDGDRASVSAVALDPAQRAEEIARMLSGAEITDEARAAARKLLRPSSDGPAPDLFAAGA